MAANRDDANAAESGADILIYGVPLEELHDKSLGSIVEGQEGYPFIGIVYCGYKAGENDVRLATSRLFYFKKSDVIEERKIEEFMVEGVPARRFRLAMNVEIYEKSFHRVNLGAELSRARTLASVVATPPGGADLSRLASMSREELQTLADNAISGTLRMAPWIPHWEMPDGGGGFGGGFGSGCNTWYQSYKETRYDPWSRRDPDGADCD